jgi:hypothetical protein
MSTGTDMRILTWPQLVAAQFMLTVKSRRWMELFAGAIALEAMALLVSAFAQRVDVGRMDESKIQMLNFFVWMFGLSILAAVWPAFLWRDEAPLQRRYHWSLPAGRGAHDLARVAAGAIWILILSLLVVVAVATWLPLVHQEFANWPIRFTVALLAAYSLASIAALNTERPVAWILGTIAVCAAIAGIVASTDFYTFHHGFRRIPFELVLGKAGLLTMFFDFANDRNKAGLVWLCVGVVGLAIVTLRRAGTFRLAVQRTP